ncbi:DNA-directed RNA polymerase subunit D [Halalkalicoccus jeotgali]|uniref:DNA-directed RNA polymerase subunit Rpo3 n=1 Tax=Halalkalicoccus jeotgali (strain DSM 18796 / CECT 7217 / JCM 14584 / KCTC 4019 / B3) TaxID=795797 RepID=D8J326_HALJB|nr:DNA-directed RNA polymerase subunit D [Halalkalicoccus jeotgali]ADJ15133.1 DNA-directed RNA polymerase subunit D [Halalkalicoccus jeotgali B3]ELY35147.1 DNA-directed RNA polymerase subunit D [Halalkalicoccus jeotgali B3]
MEGNFDVEIIERDDRSARFLVRGATPAFANGIRRAMLADVPTLSIDSVRFIENSSVMFNEQLALRLGLVPLSTPEDYELGEDVTLALDVEGPATAYSGDLVSSDEQVEPADRNVPIIELKEGQRLELEADAVLDVGREHAKHQGGVAVGYRHLVRVNIEGDREEFADEEANIVRGVVETDEGELVLTDEFDHDLTNRYPGKELRLEDVPDAFVFHVETDGSMTASELVDRAAASLGDRARELEDAVAL